MTDRRRLEVRAQILSCTSCELSGRCTSPVPFDGPNPAKLAVIGEAPGKLEDERGRPFVGPSGELLKESLTRAGFAIGEIFFMNAASCFPVDFQGKGRAPNAKEVEACELNLRTQMDLSGANYFLLTGGVPLSAVRKGLKIGQGRGRPIAIDATRTDVGKRFALPTYHPSYVLRSGGWGGDAHKLVMEDLAFLQRLMEAEEPLDVFPGTCYCGEDASQFENDGVAWCEKHEKK